MLDSGLRAAELGRRLPAALLFSSTACDALHRVVDEGQAGRHGGMLGA
jgi:hypothetical protein